MHYIRRSFKFLIKKVLMYIEASEAGTMFYGLLPEDSRSEFQFDKYSYM